MSLKNFQFGLRSATENNEEQERAQAQHSQGQGQQFGLLKAKCGVIVVMEGFDSFIREMATNHPTKLFGSLVEVARFGWV